MLKNVFSMGIFTVIGLVYSSSAYNDDDDDDEDDIAYYILSDDRLLETIKEEAVYY